jgi:hypothetical protein
MYVFTCFRDRMEEVAALSVEKLRFRLLLTNLGMYVFTDCQCRVHAESQLLELMAQLMR